MQDITNGRINCRNLTHDEWEMMVSASSQEWFAPSDDDWLLVKNMLSLFDIRRGYKIKTDSDGIPYILSGTAQIKLNADGHKALEMRRDGKFHMKGEPTRYEDIAPYMTDSERLLFEDISNFTGNF